MEVVLRYTGLMGVAILVVLEGCTVATNIRGGDQEPNVWGRADCQRGAGNPELQQQFEDAKSVCLGRGESEEMVAGAVGGSVCMTERGYVLRTRAEHVAACQNLRPPTDAPLTRAKGPIAERCEVFLGGCIVEQVAGREPRLKQPAVS